MFMKETESRHRQALLGRNPKSKGQKYVRLLFLSHFLPRVRQFSPLGSMTVSEMYPPSLFCICVAVCGMVDVSNFLLNKDHMESPETARERCEQPERAWMGIQVLKINTRQQNPKGNYPYFPLFHFCMASEGVTLRRDWAREDCAQNIIWYDLLIAWHMCHKKLLALYSVGYSSHRGLVQ